MPGPTRCWCSSSMPRWPQWTRRFVRRALPGRSAPPSDHRRQLQLRQGAQRRPGAAQQLGAQHSISRGGRPVLLKASGFVGRIPATRWFTATPAPPTHVLSRDYAIEGVVHAATRAAASSATRPRTWSSAIPSGRNTASPRHAAEARRGRASGRRQPRRAADVRTADRAAQSALFGFEGDLYGRMMASRCVRTSARSRKYGDVADLVAHMRRGRTAARRLLALP